jgi:predicted DNA-binding transcriptional regulator AlpA
MDRATERLGRLNQLCPKCQTGIDRFMSVKEVEYVTGLSDTEILDRRVPQGRFPKPIKLGKHRNSRIVWRESEIREWMEQRERENPYVPRDPANDNLSDQEHKRVLKDKLLAALRAANDNDVVDVEEIRLLPKPDEAA